MNSVQPLQFAPSNTIIHTNPHGTVFLTASGAIGMEFGGRLSVHTIEQWIAQSWGDLSKPSLRPTDTSLACGLGDQSISLRGHPYER